MISRRNNLGQIMANPKLKDVSKELLIELYWNQNLNQKQTASNLDVPRRSLTRRMKELGIPLRSLSERHRRKFSEEHKNKIRQALKGKPSPLKGRTFPEAWRKNMSDAAKRRCEDPIIRSKLQKGLHLRPTKPEMTFKQLCLEHNLPYRYVGDGSFWIGRRNPDFVHNEEKCVIEIFGSYWHSSDEVNERIEYFRRYGFSCIIIWDYQLNDSQEILKMLKKGWCGK